MATELRETELERFGTYPLFQLTQSVTGATKPEQIYEAALDCLRESLGVTKSSILLFDKAGVMRFCAWRNLSDAYRQAVEGHSPWDPDTPDPRPVLVPDVRADASLAGLIETIEGEGIRALAFVPLSVSGRLIGKFMLYYAEPHTFTDAEVMFARTIASQVAFAIDQQQHRDQQEHLQAIFRSSVTAIAEVDSEGSFLVVNDQFCELTGHTRQALVEHIKVFETVHEADRPTFSARIEGLAAGGNAFDMELRHERPDARPVWVSATVSAIRDPEGAFRGAVLVETDVTERKLAEEVLRSSEQRYRELVDALVLAVYTTDAAGRITMYNEAAANLWGRRPELNQDLWCGSWRIFTPEGEPLPLDSCPMAITIKENRPVRNVEILVERPDGTRASILPFPTPLHDSEGNMVGAVNVLVDITERKRAEAALRESEERFRFMADNAPAMIWMSDARRGPTFLSKGFREFSGWSESEHPGEDWIDSVHPEDRDACLETYTKTFEAREPFGMEYRMLRADGHYRWVLSHASPIFAPDGTFTGYIGSLLDVTERHEAEQRMREAARLKDQFLGLVSHELRTPISTIYGYSVLLQRRGEKLSASDTQQALQDIVNESEKLQQIIENLLLLTRLEAGQPDFGPLRLETIVRNEVAVFRRRNPGRILNIDVAESLPPARGQEMLVSILLQNLLSNARKYSPPDKPIHVSVGVNEAAMVELRVRDYGIGIDMTERENLFTPFYRADRAKGHAQGMGLGLAVCKRAAEAQGGSISLNSAPGEGTEFIVLLPSLESMPATP